MLLLLGIGILLVFGYLGYLALVNANPRNPVVDRHIEFDRYCTEVTGESFYQRNFKKVSGGRTYDGFELEVTAVLLCDDGNVHDRNAVMVLVNGLQVGHLPRSFAQKYREVYGSECISCNGFIAGGWDRGYDDIGHFGITLALPLSVKDQKRAASIAARRKHSEPNPNRENEET